MEMSVSIGEGALSINKKNLGSGLFFIFVATLYGTMSLTKLPIGQIFNMGPGFFPIVLCSLLAVFGAMLVARAVFSGVQVELGDIPWRVIAMLTLSVVTFGLSFSQLGILPSVFVSTFIATLAGRRFSLRTSLLVSGGVALLCAAIFGFALTMPVGVLGSWFGR